MSTSEGRQNSTSPNLPEEARILNISPNEKSRGDNEVTEAHVLSDRWDMRFLRYFIKRRDGSMGEQRVVEFTKPGILVFIADRKRNLLMTEVYQCASDRTTLEPVGGTILEDDKTGLKTVESKALGEAGYRVVHVEQIHPQHPQRQLTSRIKHEQLAFFAIAEAVVGSPTEPDIVEVRWVPYDDLYKKSLSGEYDNPGIAMEIVRIRPFIGKYEKFSHKLRRWFRGNIHFR
jgi:hypothetical protein